MLQSQKPSTAVNPCQEVRAEKAQVFNRLVDGEPPRLEEVMAVRVVSPFDRQEKCYAGAPVPVRNWREVLAVFSRPEVAENVRAVRAAYADFLDCQAREAEARAAGDTAGAELWHKTGKEADEIRGKKKRQLPLIIFGGTTDGGARKDENIRQSAFYALDVDHLSEAPREVWRRALPFAEKAGVVLAYVSPSGAGLKVVYKRQLSDIAADQRRVYRELGFASLPQGCFDEAVKDPSRGSFVSTKEDILYFDATPAASPTSPLQPSPAVLTAQAETPKAPGAAAAKDYPTEFDGVPLTAIARAYMKKKFGHEVPPEHQRNTELHTAACTLKWVTDFDPAWLAQILPANGLPQSEVLQLCRRACDLEVKTPGMPRELRAVIDALKPTLASTPETAEWYEEVRRPVLPPGWEEVIQSCPEEFRDTATLASAPCWATLGTGIRAYSHRSHPDDVGELQHPTVFFIGEAPMAGNKSMLKHVFDLITEPLAQQDYENALKEEEWRKEFEVKQNAKQLPPRPETVRRLISATTSRTQFYRRQYAAGGKHLLKYSTELSEVTGFRKRGDWADPTSDDKKAFDNDRIGSDFAQKDAFNMPQKALYNIFYLTTPGERKKYFAGKEEDGTISRYIFASLPYRIGAPEQHCKKLTAEGVENLHKQQQSLTGIGGAEGTKFYDLTFLDKERAKWTAKMNAIAERTQDAALGTYLRRAAVIGFRVAMLAAAMWDAEGNWTPLMKKRIKQMFHFVAQMALRGQMERYADPVRKQHEGGLASPRLPYARLFSVLPQEFTREDLKQKARQRGYARDVRKILNDWRRGGFWEQTEAGEFMKVKPSPAA